jgi:tetratricopeptide (TPR) repeat protein
MSKAESKYQLGIILALLISSLGIMSAGIAAQPLPIPTATSSPQSTLSPQEREEVGKVVEKEIQDSGEIRDRVQAEVQSTFGWTVNLLNVLIAVLIAIPGGAGLTVFLLRRTILNELVGTVRGELKAAIDAELKQKLKEYEQTIEAELKQQLNIAKQKLAELQEFLEKKDLLVEQISEFAKRTPTPYEESIEPEDKAAIQILAKELESLQSSSPELPLTASDYLAQGDALYFQDKFQAAVDAYEQAIALQPNSHEAWINKGKALRRLGRYEEALSASTEAAAIKPNSPWPWFGRGYALQDLHRYQEALEAFDRAIKIRPDHYWSWKHRGYALTKLGRYPEAVKSFDGAFKINSQRPGGTHYWKAYYYVVLGEIDAAIAELQQAFHFSPRFKTLIKTDPDFDAIRQIPQFQQLIQS